MEVAQIFERLLVLGFKLSLLKVEILLLGLDNHRKLSLFSLGLFNKLFKLGNLFEVPNFLARNLLVK